MTDSHAHLSDSRYLDLPKIVKDFFDLGGKRIIDIGYNEESSKKAKDNSKEFKNVFFACGIHPSEASKSYDIGVIGRLLDDERCVALGEIGLDYHYDNFDKNKQFELFERQIILAHEKNKPIVIHSRDASLDMLQILKANSKYLDKGFLMHCYSETKEQAKNYLDLGAYFSFGGPITFKNSNRDEVVRYIPVSQIMAETDCPYLCPHPYRGRLNEPKMVKLVYEKLSEILGKSVLEIDEQIEKNVLAFFGKSVAI